MPAIYVDTLSVPRLSDPTVLGKRFRRAGRVYNSISTFEGEGFPVRRPFPTADLSVADPFLLLDQMGSVDYGPGEAKGTPWHPHRGFETVTYILDGVMEHRDSIGGGGVITNGDTQWMTAGAGILHIETPPEWLVVKGGLFHGVQLWVNLPANQKMISPKYQDIHSSDLGLVSSHDGGGLIRVIAGELEGHTGPGRTQTPIIYAHVTVAPGARVAIDWPEDHTAMVYSLAGSGSISEDRVSVSEGQLGVFDRGGGISFFGDASQPSYAEAGWEILLLGGVPIGEPVARYGPFVMNTKAELVQAYEDFQSGRMGNIPAERIPHRGAADEDPYKQ